MAALYFCLSSCGLAVYYVLGPPKKGDSPATSSTNYAYKYFDFVTDDSDNYSTIGYTGTKVYYKIYNNWDELNSQVSSISTVNKLYSQNGYNKMKVTFGYQELYFVNSGSYDLTHSNFIKNNDNSNQDIQIRLITEGADNAKYYYGVYIDQETEDQLTDGSAKAIVYRNNGDPFLIEDVKNDDITITSVPTDIERAVAVGKTGDHDDMYISSTSDDYWYVAAYAVSYGQDTSYRPFYSEVEYLGYLTFDYDD